MPERQMYFDNAATTRPYKEVLDTMQHFFSEQFYNPSSMYRPAIEAEKEIEEARESIAKSLGVRADRIFFNSGGTEGSNTILRGVVEKLRDPNVELITTSVEHPAVLEVFKYFEKKGHPVHYLSVDSFGRANLEELKELLSDKTGLVSIMAVNNELGSVNDLVQAGKLIREKAPQAVFHSDFVQGYLKVTDPKLNIHEADLDAINFCGHKIHGPKGIGAVYLKEGLRIAPLLLGGGQEKGFRSGTENAALIKGFEEAVKYRTSRVKELEVHSTMLKDRLISNLEGIEGMVINSPEDGSGYILNLSFPGIKAEVLLHMLEDQGIFISTGSACATHHKGGHVQRACRMDKLREEGSIRISTSEFNTAEEVDALSDAIKMSLIPLMKLARLKKRR